MYLKYIINSPRLLSLTFVFFITLSCFGQEEAPFIKKGNEAYRKGDYFVADSAYKQALGKKYDSQEALFNAGNTYYQIGSAASQLQNNPQAQQQLQQQGQGQKMDFAAVSKGAFEQAKKKYEELLKQDIKDKTKKAKAYHNLGNTFMQQQDYQKAAKQYKDALRNDPSNENARYNLAYALDKLKNQQNQNQNQDQQNQDQNENQENQDQNQDNKEGNDQNQDQNQYNKEGDQENQQNQEQEGKDEQEQNQQDQQQGNEEGKGEEEEQQQQQAKPGQMSRDEAEKMLQALMQQEQELQDKNGKKEKGRVIKICLLYTSDAADD